MKKLFIMEACLLFVLRTTFINFRGKMFLKKILHFQVTMTFCVQTTYFRMGSDIYQEEGLAMGSPLLQVLANIYMKYFEDWHH